MYICCLLLPFFFFLTDTSTTEIYTLSLHDALPIFLVFALEFLEGRHQSLGNVPATIGAKPAGGVPRNFRRSDGDRKSTRLNSSHTVISYAVFCLKKKKKKIKRTIKQLTITNIA